MDVGPSRPLRSPSSASDHSSRQRPYSSSPLGQSTMGTGDMSGSEELETTDPTLRRGSEWPDGPLDVSSTASSSQQPRLARHSNNYAATGRKRSHSTSPRVGYIAQLPSTDHFYSGVDGHRSPPWPMTSSSQSVLPATGSSSQISPSHSSAPPTPSLLATTHPSLFIHTHLPKRSSQVPLSLNLISPVGPILASTGTSPPASLFSDRRSSAASSRRDRPRRSSLTPSMSALAAANTTKAHVYASPTDPSPSAPPMHAKTRTDDSLSSRKLPLSQPLLQELAALHMQGRRGSMPHIGNSSSWKFLPTLTTQRPSVGDEAMEGFERFRFGSNSATTTGETSLPTSTAAVSTSPGTARTPSDVFAQAEATEAERQRRAFVDATYGADGRRARERLSIGGAGTSNVRRESLLLWNQLGSASSPPSLFAEHDLLRAGPSELAGRRGSLPVAIPWGDRARLTKKEQKRRDEVEEESLGQDRGTDAAGNDEDGEEDEIEDEDDDGGGLRSEEGWGQLGDWPNLHVINSQAVPPPMRPLPPLLPLSDPGPRLLPSTLALHRANHLLNARNLEADPLPHPLPPSLHPPAPVDLAEFDIDFILAGSQAQLGRDKRKGSRSSGNLSGKVPSAREIVTGTYPPTPTLQLGRGGEDEDTFAKFVGQFDDEYGGRRGEWTFRACPPSAPSQGASHDHSTFGSSCAPSLSTPKGEWDSRGAGRYELYASGEISSVNTGKTWRVRRTGSREYELEKVRDWQGRSSTVPGSAHRDTSSTGSLEVSSDFNLAPSCTASGTNFVLAAKLIHREHGGVKTPNGQRKGSGASTPRSARSGSRAQPSFSRTRFGSEESTSTARPFSRSLPLDEHALSDADVAATFSRRASVVEKSRDRQETRASPASRPVDILDGVDDLPPLLKASSSKERRQKLKDSESLDERGKKDRSFSSVIKRGWLASINRSQNDTERKERREEKERERLQSQSWSGASSSSETWSNHGEPPVSGPIAVIAPRRDTEAWTRDSLLAGSPRASTDISRAIGIEDEQNGGLPWQEGKAWSGVPEEALAMVIPLEGCPCAKSSTLLSDVQQALLVYFVPFNSLNNSEGNAAASTGGSYHHAPSASTSHRILQGAKLLRRKGSREKEALQRDQREYRGLESSSGHAVGLLGHPAGNFVLHPLPFRSFRLVARVVNIADLRSEPTALNWTSFKTASESALFDTPVSTPPNGATEQPVTAGRNFPTVIAVCHSRSQGVEFVLEGLDRLGFCEGKSAWGPTGYEEWRGSGLSEEGRGVLDLLWAGCAGVMGLASV